MIISIDIRTSCSSICMLGEEGRSRWISVRMGIGILYVSGLCK